MASVMLAHTVSGPDARARVVQYPDSQMYSLTTQAAPAVHTIRAALLGVLLLPVRPLAIPYPPDSVYTQDITSNPVYTPCCHGSFLGLILSTGGSSLVDLAVIFFGLVGILENAVLSMTQAAMKLHRNIYKYN